MNHRALAAGLVLAVAAARSAPAAESAYVVSSAKSSVLIHVGKTGLFGFAGHRHEIEAEATGTVHADPENLGASRLELIFAADRLRVLPEGEPRDDPPKVEAVMRGPQVLDALRFPEIRFRSTHVSGRELGPGKYALTLEGHLSLHGVERALTVPVSVIVEGGTLTAIGRLTLRHDEYGMKPVSAGAGTVKVANDLPIDFRIVAERESP